MSSETTTGSFVPTQAEGFKMPAHFFDAMKSRGLVAQVSHEEELIEMLSKHSTASSSQRDQNDPCAHPQSEQLSPEHRSSTRPQPLSVYAGFDPTARSLHVGHLVPLLGLRRAQDAGLRPIVLFGGATGLVGDPTGRTEMRKLNTAEDIAGYVENYTKLTARYFAEDSPQPALYLNNHDWLGKMSWITFARDVGVHFTIARLLAADVNRTRYESGGLTFLELGYQLLQAFDFLHLYRQHNCIIQLGGNDQWSNILAGADLIRRTEAAKAFALTFPLLTAADGSKIGKTAGNAVWLDPNLMKPYDFFHYFRNIQDADLGLCLRTFTFFEDTEIEELCDSKRTAINAGKERLAHEVSRIVHGEEEANRALGAARALFSGKGAPDNAPSFQRTNKEWSAGVLSIDILVASGLCKSKSEARKLIEGGGLNLNGSKVLEINHSVFISDFTGTPPIATLRKGKKEYLVLRIKED